MNLNLFIRVLREEMLYRCSINKLIVRLALFFPYQILIVIEDEVRNLSTAIYIRSKIIRKRMLRYQVVLV